jgi:hypothetical protein
MGGRPTRPLSFNSGTRLFSGLNYLLIGLSGFIILMVIAMLADSVRKCVLLIRNPMPVEVSGTPPTQQTVPHGQDARATIFQQADCYQVRGLARRRGGKTLKIFRDFTDFRRNTVVIETGGAKICTFIEMFGYKAGNRVPAAHGQFYCSCP